MDDDVISTVVMAVGEATCCWSDIDNAGLYNAEQASAITQRLIEFVDAKVRAARAHERATLLASLDALDSL